MSDVVLETIDKPDGGKRIVIVRRDLLRKRPTLALDRMLQTHSPHSMGQLEKAIEGHHKSNALHPTLKVMGFGRA